MSLAPAGTVAAGTTDQWRDRKRHLWLIALVIPSLAAVVLILYAFVGWRWLFWAGPLLLFVVVPLLDLAVGLDPSNPPDEVIEALANDRYYRVITYLFIPLQYLVLLMGMWIIAGANPAAWLIEQLGLTAWFVEHAPYRFTSPSDLTFIDRLGIAIAIGLIGGIAINTAHELGHKKVSLERWLSKIALAQTAYGHFYIEHNRGHHVRVATPQDPASARMGESYYAFLPRTVIGSLRSAWRVESRRFTRKGQSPLRLDNDILNAGLMTLVLWGGLVAWLGWGILPWLLLQAAVGIALLEAVNYLEHYGMLRQRVGAPGHERFEKVDPSHSWNSNNIATNVLLFHLQRHSDHHANPTRRYQCLRDFRESPVLPTGYAGMITLALFPPLWRRVMDPRVIAHFGGDIRLANVSPRARERLYAAYPPPVGEIAVDRVALAPAAPNGMDVLAAVCPGCDYRYEVEAGDEHEGFAAGTSWADIPADWHCPDCGVRSKEQFLPVTTRQD